MAYMYVIMTQCNEKLQNSHSLELLKTSVQNRQNSEKMKFCYNYDKIMPNMICTISSWQRMIRFICMKLSFIY